MILPGSVKQSNAASFILPAQEIPRFVRLLQIFRTQHFTGTFKLQFHGQTDCHNPPDPVVQRLVLDPFRSLDLDDHSLLFDGAIDIAYQQELRASIVPRIGWIRGLAWKTYDILVSLAEEGHEAFRLGKYDCAGNRYDDALTACVLAFGEHPILGAFCDTEWQGHCSTLYLNTRANYALAAVRQGDWPRVLAATSALATTTDLTQSAMYRCRAIALAVQKDDKQSLDCLSKAAAMDPTNESLQSLVHGTTEESTQALAVISSAAYHGELTYLVDTSPLQLEVNISIAEERCVLLFFRYSGDLLFDRIRGSNQMDRNKVARVIKEIINGMKEKARTNSNLCAWIGEEANVHYFPD
jgi:tetratricopeptide (TPR) repeat protein